MRKLLGVLGFLTIIVATLYVTLPVGHIPLYDANLVRLAETELEGYCAGYTFPISNGVGDDVEAASCRRTYASRYSEVFSPSAAERAFCGAIADSGRYGTDQAGCIMTIRSGQYWPTYAGSLTNDWNRARPYPLTTGLSEAEPDDSRTGGRGVVNRNPPTRDYTYSPTPSPSASPSPTGTTGPTGGTG